MKNRTVMIVGGIIVALIVCAGVAAAGWYLASPLFIDDVVEEEFPFEMPSEEKLAEMTDEELAAMEAEVLAASADMPDEVMEEPMPEEAASAEPIIVAQGQFQDADSFHQGSGSATIYQLADGSHVLRFEDFEVTNGPDLHVLLSTAGGSGPTPSGRSDIGEYIDLGSLKGNIGSQNYEIPVDVDLSQYQSVVIYCMPFHVVFSTAGLGS
ncbi:MAG: DM13 domain-containing protein [Chloroflexota bacterium]